MKIKSDKYDITFSIYIRKKANWTCQRCGKVCRIGEEWIWRLDCSHFWGRGNQSVRFDEENADAHCFTCHEFLGSNPEEFRAWKLNQMGREAYEALRKRAREVKKWNKGEKNDMRKMYQNKIDELDRL